jgi:hypothetical protein
MQKKDENCPVCYKLIPFPEDWEDLYLHLTVKENAGNGWLKAISNKNFFNTFCCYAEHHPANVNDLLDDQVE